MNNIKISYVRMISFDCQHCGTSNSCPFPEGHTSTYCACCKFVYDVEKEKNKEKENLYKDGVDSGSVPTKTC